MTHDSNEAKAGMPEGGSSPDEAGELDASMTAEELARLQAAAAEADSLREQVLRVQADFQNFRRRMERDVEDRVRRRMEPLLGSMLAGVDELDRAIQSATPASHAQLVDGVRMIREILMATAAREGVKEIPTMGLPFDPKLHEALTSVPTAEHTPGTVLHEQRRGYLWNDRVLRPSQVVIAVAPESGAPQSGGSTSSGSAATE